MAREQVHRTDPDHAPPGTQPPGHPISGDSLEQLQHDYGNQAVRGLLAKPKRVLPKKQTGLPDALKSGVESLSGMSLDNVDVHYNSSEPAQLDALAFTQGSDI